MPSFSRSETRFPAGRGNDAERRTPDGQYCSLERLDPKRHADDLFAANAHYQTGANWTYLTYGPFDDPATYRDWVAVAAVQTDPLFLAVIDPTTSRAVGVTSYMRIAAAAGSVEVGNINYSPLLQRTRAGTEAMYLMMRRVFEDWGYRRYEWKCNALNKPSMTAAKRFGFTFEGIFRQAEVAKGRNRDTAWFSVLDSEWSSIKAGFEAWLDPNNFDESGNQLSRLDTRAG